MTKREQVIQFLRQRLATAKDFAAKADRSEVQFQYEESAAKFQAALALIADLTVEVEAARLAREDESHHEYDCQYVGCTERPTCPQWKAQQAYTQACTAVDAWDKEVTNGKA